MVEARPHVRAQATDLGIEAITPAEARSLPPAHLVVDVSFDPKGVGSALFRDRAGWRLHQQRRTAPHSQGAIALLYGRNATFRVGRTHARAVIPAVLELMSAGRLHPELVTTCVAPFDDAPRALHDHVCGHGTKTIVAEAGVG